MTVDEKRAAERIEQARKLAAEYPMTADRLKYAVGAAKHLAQIAYATGQHALMVKIALAIAPTVPDCKQFTVSLSPLVSEMVEDAAYLCWATDSEHGRRAYGPDAALIAQTLYETARALHDLIDVVDGVPLL